MENRPHPNYQTSSSNLAIHLDDDIISDLAANSIDLTHLKISPIETANIRFLKKQGRLWVQYEDGHFCDFPYYLKNILSTLESFQQKPNPRSDELTFTTNFIKTVENIQKKVFSNIALRPEQNVKDLWDEIMKKVMAISADSHSLNHLVEKILQIPFLQNFESSFLLVHLKGQTKVALIGSTLGNEKISRFIEVKDFNTFYHSVKKSKHKSFSTNDFLKLDLPFNGSFLAKEIVSKKYSLIAMVSRQDFLGYSLEEIELFEICIDLLEPHFERLIDQEFSDKKISELRLCLKDFPLPIKVCDAQTGVSFMNDLYQNELQDKDIFFNKKIYNNYSIDLYDSDELRHYAFDLFHFQRVSLLGELLNTLRHELSNPLFGLKLGTQIFSTLEVSADDKMIMQEIEKNVNRCQQIIENFSNLYQIQAENKPHSIKKMIDESLLLAKSEIRDVTKEILFEPGTEEIELQIPVLFIVQILFNLLVNAAQAMRSQSERGIIKLIVKRELDQLNIFLQDNGPGIPDDKIGQIFKPFFTTKTQGTGLGLVLSRNLAQKLDGNLEYISSQPNKGACFKLSLPIK